MIDELIKKNKLILKDKNKNAFFYAIIKIIFLHNSRLIKLKFTIIIVEYGD